MVLWLRIHVTAQGMQVLSLVWGLRSRVCVCVYVCVRVCMRTRAQLYPTLCDPMDCSLPGSSVHGIFQARILEWVAISFSRGPSQPRDPTQVACVSYIGRQILHASATWDTKITHASQQLRPLAATAELVLESPHTKTKVLCAMTKVLRATTKTPHSWINKWIF